MSNDQKAQFHAVMTAALADREAARDEIFYQLQNLAPDERAKVPPETFARLSAEQFAVLLGRPLPKLPFDAKMARASAPSFGRGDDLESFARHTKSIKIRSPLQNAFRLAGIVGLCTGLASGGSVCAEPYLSRLAPPPIRPANVNTWPQCARLDSGTDGCVYFVQSALTWAEAAQLLGMPQSTLASANRVIGTQPLTQGSPIIVWRFRRPLSS
jgi:hypothetical protein